MDYPLDFRCPISMEVMEDPVTIATGMTYERRNIQKWFFAYKKKTCPATMQSVESFDVTPNHTLKRLIIAWQSEKRPGNPLPAVRGSTERREQIVTLLEMLESSPFKVTSLKKLKLIIETDDEAKANFVQSGGIQIVVRIMNQVLEEGSDFSIFRACEEALGVLHQLLLSEEAKILEKLSKPESMKCVAAMLQRGSAEARIHATTILRQMAQSETHWTFVLQDHGIDLFKSLLELVSDEICTRASSYALEVLVEMLSASKKSRVRAIEAGAVCVLVELLPESNRSKSEKILALLKLLCECAEGRLAIVDHGMGIAAVTKKMLHVSSAATKLSVKIVWLIGSFHPSERVLEEMLICGSVKKLLALLHIDGRSSTKEKVIKMFKLHGQSWQRCPCFPNELKGYVGMVNSA
ncbi:E3 ubiquitin-protein ligase PUB23-like [Rhodamnia argentea]|uniref:U-box domain-containing protein n=1 Tax=Rhodamnia argentea TaxID=178133 RepID=A0A8B8QUZ9_9MYRT|nr:E3 ubiquitin-protein ligase PUB23-like [Rhodamnia argentea]